MMIWLNGDENNGSHRGDDADIGDDDDEGSPISRDVQGVCDGAKHLKEKRFPVQGNAAKCQKIGNLMICLVSIM